MVHYLTPIISTIGISILFVSNFIKTGMLNSLPTLSGSVYEQFTWTLSLTLLGLLGVTILYWFTSRERDFELRVILAIIVAPTSAILVIILSQTVLLIVAKAVSTLIASIIVLLSLYVAVFSVVFILSDALPVRVRNFVFIIYGALLGSFISLLIPTISLVTILASVAVYDLIIFNSGWMSALTDVLKGSKRHGSRMSYYSEEIEMGLGELIFYSFIPAHVTAYYGPEMLYMTLLMTGIGIFLNLWMLNRSGMIAGLPAPIFLGLSPIAVFYLFH
jgi:hypothetical protein